MKYEPKEIGLKEFEAFLKNEKELSVVDFSAPWCAPCRALAPVFSSVAQKLGDKIAFATVNIDDNHELAHRFGVRSIPNLIVFKRDEPIGQIVGGVSEAKLLKQLEHLLQHPEKH